MTESEDEPLKCEEEDCCFHKDDPDYDPEDGERYPSVQCDGCNIWCHPVCENFFDAETSHFDAFFCNNCLDEEAIDGTAREITYRKPVYPSLQDPFFHGGLKVGEDGKVFHGKSEVIESGTEIFVKRLKEKAQTYQNGREKFNIGDRYINKEWLDEHGFDEPVFYPSGTTPNGLEIRNSERMTINYIREMLGDDYAISYFDCQTQKQFRTTLLRYYNYFEDKEEREDGTRARFLQNKLINKRFNVISIEFSDEKLADYVDIPMLFRRISWQSLVPEDLNQKYETPPKMGKYLLIGPEGSYTDWHIDMAGSSVWYHIVSGGKLFILVAPTEENLDKYRDWETHDPKIRRRSSFLEWCEKEKNPIPSEDICRMELHPGDTMLVPGGWIHCVVTTKDSLVFGGNILHTMGARMQSKCVQMELEADIPEKNKYTPFFFKNLMWYAGKQVSRELHEANVSRKRFSGKKILEAEHIYAVLSKGKKALDTIPSDIAPDDFLKKFKNRLKIHKKMAKDEPPDLTPFKEPEFAEIGTERLENGEKFEKKTASKRSRGDKSRRMQALVKMEKENGHVKQEKNDERYLPEEEFSDDEIPAEDDDFKKEPSPPPKKHAPEKQTKVKKKSSRKKTATQVKGERFASHCKKLKQK